MGKNERLLSIVVPAYNEEHTIGNVIHRVIATLEKTNLAYEVIVIDDGSKDKSAEISRSQNAMVYSLKRHMGKGYALRAGFKKAKGEIIVTIDSDGSNRPEELPFLLTPLLRNEADLVIGSRFSANMTTSGKRFNAAGVRLFNLMIRTFGKSTLDPIVDGFKILMSIVTSYLKG
jgi:glycosyltransferase involved in cell wall biosynthesis